jgi:hypothetical protein
MRLWRRWLRGIREYLVVRGLTKFMEKHDMMDYFMALSKHEDPKVREAASACAEIYRTPQWKSRTMRRYLNELSWALYNYTKDKITERGILEKLSGKV